VSASWRRTSFATPFIMTVAATASVPACSKDKGPPGNPPQPEFPGMTWSVRMLNMTCLASEHGPNPPPPRAIECPPGMSGSTTFVVGELASNECGIVPAGCADKACVKIRTPCPMPVGQKVVHKLANVWLIEKRGDKCHAEEGDEDECPPGTDCNPPSPRFVPCPAGITEEKPVRVAEMPDATCVRVPNGCDNTGCAREKIDCLPADAKPLPPD
jgi:hypothetical protein